MFEIFVLDEWENKASFLQLFYYLTAQFALLQILCLFQSYVLFIQRDLSRVNNGMVAPISNLTPGLQRAQVTHGIREVSLFRKKYATERLQFFFTPGLVKDTS